MFSLTLESVSSQIYLLNYRQPICAYFIKRKCELNHSVGLRLCRHAVVVSVVVCLCGTLESLNLCHRIIKAVSRIEK